MDMDQQHLDQQNRINQGSYYTKPHLVEAVYDMIKQHLNLRKINFLTVLDTSCGYGSFFSTTLPFHNFLGNDIDPLALEKAQQNCPLVRFFNYNSLKTFDRESYGLLPEDSLLIVGNPPYNDTTSLINKKLKKDLFEAAPQVKTRDLGISFLLSFAQLEPDYICVLHPLSYLIKPTNFKTLTPFCKKYRLQDSLIISSQEFSETSKTGSFPIVIAFYQKDPQGMTWDHIKNFNFRTKHHQLFSLNQFDWINRYVSKYPNQKSISNNQAVAKFYTLRDINALKRSQTFMTTTTSNTVFVRAEQLDYFCYIDGFKKFAHRLPYYLGNCEIMIDTEKFETYREYFRSLSALSHPFLQESIPILHDKETCLQQIEIYFRELLGPHWL